MASPAGVDWPTALAGPSRSAHLVELGGGGRGWDEVPARCVDDAGCESAAVSGGERRISVPAGPLVEVHPGEAG